MKMRTFKHGIHPNDGKALTADAAIQPFRPTGEAVYPLSQHIGAPAKPVVAVGDTVTVGQMLAQPDGFISAAVCSAVSGKVKAIERRRTVNGKEVPSVVVNNDGLFTPCEGYDTPRDYTTLSPQAILDIIRDAGIIGQGGAGFPTHVKLTMKEGVQPEYILVNAAECEPYLTSDYRLMLERPEQLLEGLQVLLYMFPQAQAIIGIEANKPRAITLLTDKMAEAPRIAVQALETKYPQGGERMLIRALTGREIHATKLPIAAGCVVMNVSTVVSIGQAVCHRIPQISTVVSITGDAVANPCNLEVPVGSSQREVLDFAGGLKAEAEKIISGGPLMGISMISLDVPILKTSGAILAMQRDEVAAWEPTACIRCGRCVRACPEFLLPPMLAQAADNGDWEGFEKLYGIECMECGSCTFVCPAKRRLTQSFRTAKATLNDKRRAALNKS